MTVKDVVMAAAESVGIGEKVKAYLETGAEEGKKDAQMLLGGFNRVENEVALDFLPLYVEEKATIVDGKIAYQDLSRTAVRILRVTKDGKSVKFRLFPQYIEVKDEEGEVNVFYSYAPKKKSFEDESDFQLIVSERMFADGVAAEFCLAAGLFEEAQHWDQKYKDALAATYRVKTGKVAKARRWV